MGEGRRRCHVAAWGRRWRGVRRGNLQVPIGMVVTDEGWEKTVHMLSCVTYVTNEHSMFVKLNLTYLAASVIRGRGGQDSGREGGRGEDRGLG